MNYVDDKIYKRMIRVDLAGEKGACYVYAGQMWALSLLGKPENEALRDMYEKEVSHVVLFEKLKDQFKVNETVFDPLWKIGGWSLGVLTALGGDKTAMTCTEAIEEVIENHYAGQVEELREINANDPLVPILEKCQEEESHHRLQAIDHGAYGGKLKEGIKGLTRLAIWLSERW